jgi:uncharacterized protein YerC
MATQTIEFEASGGQTLTAKAFAAGSDVQAGSASATEATNRKGTYTVSFSGLAGTYKLIALSGTTPVATARFVCTDIAATFFSGDLVSVVGANVINAAAIADGAIDTATFASGTTIPRVTLADTLTTYTSNTPQTGDSFARIGAAGAGLTAVDDATLAAIAALNNLSSAQVTSAVPTVLQIQSGLATAAQINSMLVNTRTNISVPIEIETPDSGTQVYKIRLYIYDVEGNPEAPDSTPTIDLTNAAGTNRAWRLSSPTTLSTGGYSWDYTATAADAEEQLIWLFTVVEGGLTRVYPATSYVVEQSAYRFSSADRATLNAASTQASVNALNNLSQANVRAAVGLTSANLDTQLDALPTNAELATALATADDATLAAIAALNNLSSAQVTSAVPTVEQIQSGLPTNAELATALATADDATLAAIAALNNLSSAQVTSAVPTVEQIQSGLPTAAEVAKIPKVGSTHRYTQIAADTGTKRADVSITDTP